MGDFGTCRRCGVQVDWAPTAASAGRKKMPLVRDPENGNVVLDGFGRAHVFSTHEVAIEAMESDEQFPLSETHIAHHAVCPDRPANVEREVRKQRKPAQEEIPF